VARSDVAAQRREEAGGIDASADSRGLDDEPRVRERDGGRAGRVSEGGQLPDEPDGSRLTQAQDRLDVAGRWRRREERDCPLRQRSSRVERLGGRRSRIQPEHLRRHELQRVPGGDDAHRCDEPRGRDVRDLPGGRGAVAPADVRAQYANAGERLPAVEVRACEERRGDGGRERRESEPEVERRAGAAAAGSCDENGHVHEENALS